MSCECEEGWKAGGVMVQGGIVARCWRCEQPGCQKGDEKERRI